MPQESRPFADFQASLAAPRSDRRYAEDFDLGALAALQGDERERAEDLLLARLAADTGDDRVAPALGLLQSQRAVAPLRAALATARGSARVRFAQALAQLEPSFNPVPDYLAELSGSDWAARAQAAGALAGRTEADAIDGLLDALTREPFGARIQAMDALVQSLGLAPHKAPRHSPLREIGMLLLSDIPSVARDGASRMRRVVEGLQAGQSPQAVGLADAPNASAAAVDRLLEALQNRAEPERDFTDLEQLGSAGSRFVESVLLAQLHTDDPRVPRALAKVGTARAVAPLQEALKLPLEQSSKEVAQALRTLQARLGTPTATH